MPYIEIDLITLLLDLGGFPETIARSWKRRAE
jgi:hypothetical protein